MSGIKYDLDKPQMYLLPPRATLEVGKVLTYGAHKYSPENWKLLDNLQERYTSACLRHILAEMSGEEVDSETNLSHLAHAICCLLFKLEVKLSGESKSEGRRESDFSKHSESDRATESIERRIQAYHQKRGV